jgi:hypothetical protein
MSEPLIFVSGVIKEWGVILTSSAGIGAVALYQGTTGRIVQSPVYWTIGIGGVFLACYRVWLKEHRKAKGKDGETTPEETNISTATATANPVQTFAPSVDASQKIEQHFHLPAAPEAKRPAPVAPDNRLHNVRFLEIRVRPMTVVACFQNVPIANKPLATFGGARVKIDYLRNDGSTFMEICPATWLEDEKPAIDLEVGKSHYATVAVFADGKWNACETQTVDTTWGETFEIERHQLHMGKLIQAIVTLLGNFGVSLEPVRLRLILHPDGRAEFNVENA